MNAETYLKETEPAVKHLFDGLEIYDTIQPPSIMEYVDETGEVRMTKKESDEMIRMAMESFAVHFSRATLAGSILQVAYVGLKKFSKNHRIPMSCEAFEITPSIRNYCVGREVHNIPIGLLIYAGRVQYNHWEDGLDLNPTVQKVFDQLVQEYYYHPAFDLVYCLGWPEAVPVSQYIVRNELRWNDYDSYKVDMTSILSK